MKYGPIAGAALLLVLAGCGTDTTIDKGPTSSAGSPAPSAVARSYPGLFPEYQGKFRPDHSDLGGRSNAELAALLPPASAYPSGGKVLPVSTAAEDGSGLGLHGQTDGETRPAQCLYTPFGKYYSRAADGSDWNLYYAAAQSHRAPDGSTITVTVYRQREGTDVIALTNEWIKGCGAYEMAYPTFAKPELATVAARDTFGPGPVVDGVPTYRYVSDMTPVDPEAARARPVAKWGGDERVVLARIRSVAFVVQGTGATAEDAMDELLAAAVAKARAAA